MPGSGLACCCVAVLVAATIAIAGGSVMDSSLEPVESVSNPSLVRLSQIESGLVRYSVLNPSPRGWAVFYRCIYRSVHERTGTDW